MFYILKTNFHRAVITVNLEDSYLIKFSKDVSFMHKASLRNALMKIPNHTRLLIDGTKSNFIDQDIIETIEDFMASAKAKHIDVNISGIKLSDKVF